MPKDNAKSWLSWRQPLYKNLVEICRIYDDLLDDPNVSLDKPEDFQEEKAVILKYNQMINKPSRLIKNYPESALEKSTLSFKTFNLRERINGKDLHCKIVLWCYTMFCYIFLTKSLDLITTGRKYRRCHLWSYWNLSSLIGTRWSTGWSKC